MASATPNPTPVPIANITAHTEQQQPPRQKSEINLQSAFNGIWISSAIVVVGWVVVHWLALIRENKTREHTDKRERESREYADKRDRENKRAELLGILRKWEQKFVVLSPEQIGPLYYQQGGMAEIASATEMFRPCVKDKEAFDRLNVISGMDPPTMDADGSRRETVCGALRRLIAFVREA